MSGATDPSAVELDNQPCALGGEMINQRADKGFHVLLLEKAKVQGTTVVPAHIHSSVVVSPLPTPVSWRMLSSGSARESPIAQVSIQHSWLSWSAVRAQRMA